MRCSTVTVPSLVAFHAVTDRLCSNCHTYSLNGAHTHNVLLDSFTHSVCSPSGQIFPPPPLPLCLWQPQGKQTHTFSPESCRTRPTARCLVDRLPASGSAPGSGPKALLLRLTGTVQTSSPPANQLVSHPTCLPSSRHVSPQQDHKPLMVDR